MPRERTGYVFFDKAKDKWCARISYTDDTTHQRKFKKKYAGTEKQAEKLLKALVSDIEDQGQEFLAAEKMTFADLAAWYRKHKLIPAKFDKDGNLIDGRKDIRNPSARLTRLESYFGKTQIRKLSYDQIAEYRRKRIGAPILHRLTNNQIGEVGLATVDRELSLLRTVLNSAVRRGWLVRNPFHLGDNPLIQVGRENKRDVIISREEERAILEVITSPNFCNGPQRDSKGHYARHTFGDTPQSRQDALQEPSTPNWFYCYYVLSVDTGMRQGELLTLEWYQFDNGGGQMTVNRRYAKSNKDRPVRLTPRCTRALEAFRATSQIVDGEQRIFPLTASGCNNAWIRAKQFAGITRKIRIHDLRHTYVTRLVLSGIPLAIASKLVGHATIQQTMTYTNVDADTLRSSADSLEKYIN